MRMGYDLALEQQQKLIMTPELKLALKILQLPAIELDELIEQELETNPVLEIAEEVREEKTESVSEKNSKTREEEIDWKEYLQFQGKSYCLEYTDIDDATESSYDNLMTYSYTLKNHLSFQLNLTVFNSDFKEIGEYIIESLDENGYLTISIEEISEILGTSPKKVEKMLQIIQTFEPYGVGARDLKECLLIQVRQKDIRDEKIEIIIKEHLDDIANNKLNNIAKKLSISLEEAQRLGDIIKKLEPKPGRAFEGETATRYVVPDAYIEKVGDEYIITINDNLGPRLMINQYYKNILKYEDKTSQASAFINDKLASAMWLIKSLEHRKNTLYNVLKAIVDYQREFFDKGAIYLKTMTLKNIADTIGVHESTVSRAISGKYVQTPRGVFEIKYFFKSGVDNNNGEAISSESIKKMIKAYISEEDSLRPISDQSITELLEKKGFVISRRTVAKYRDEMGIPASSKRKRF